MPLIGNQAAQRAYLRRSVGHQQDTALVTDDLLDATGDTATLGKTAGADAALGKATYVSILGLAGAEARADRLLEAGLEALSPLPQGDRLAAALHWVRNRRF